MMQVVAPGKYQTAHYAFSTGIMAFSYTFFTWFSDDIQIALGYKNFFIWVLIASVPVAILSQIIPMSAHERDARLPAVTHDRVEAITLGEGMTVQAHLPAARCHLFDTTGAAFLQTVTKQTEIEASK